MPRFLRKTENIAVLFAVLALLGVSAFGLVEFQKTQILTGQVSALQKSLADSLKTTTPGTPNTGSTSTTNNPRPPVTTTASADLSVTAAVAKVAPAVVSVVISKEVPKLQVVYQNPFGDDPRFRDYNIRIPTYQQNGTELQQVGAGTGFLVRSDGYIVTNRHVVDDPNAEYTVLLSTGAQKTAKVVYRDQNSDVALIKIDGTGYTTIPLGDSSKLQLGQTVAAIGNALGQYNNSVSVGIVSGLNRTVEAYDDQTGSTEKLSGVIQTDAAINLGNSGGPLFDLSGKAIGVNVVTAIGANSIAFAIPINVVKTIIAKEL
jgi:serine protease Do